MLRRTRDFADGEGGTVGEQQQDLLAGLEWQCSVSSATLCGVGR